MIGVENHDQMKSPSGIPIQSAQQLPTGLDNRFNIAVTASKVFLYSRVSSYKWVVAGHRHNKSHTEWYTTEEIDRMYEIHEK